MQWPQSLDYYQAVQTPPQSFADAELMSAEVVVNELGLPQSCAGNFADVYQFRSPGTGRNWAVKCFTRPVQRLNKHYREISRHLEHCQLPLTVEFKYLDEGIKIRDQWYPVLKMDWVEGQTLRQFVKAHLDAPKVLSLLFEQWRQVESWLSDAQVAHGDLQHGNILLVPGLRDDQVSLRLVDYDGMWVPGLSGEPPGEFGHPAYQHPQRLKEKVYSPAIDRFPHLAISCALRCLSWPEGPEWWERYDNGDNLLFTQTDFEAPNESQLLHELWESGNDELQSWAGHVAIASQSPLEGTPPFGTLFTNGEVLPLPAAGQNEARRLLGYAHRPEMSWAPLEPAFHTADPNINWTQQKVEFTLSNAEPPPATVGQVDGVSAAAQQPHVSSATSELSAAETPTIAGDRQLTLPTPTTTGPDSARTETEVGPELPIVPPVEKPMLRRAPPPPPSHRKQTTGIPHLGTSRSGDATVRLPMVSAPKPGAPPPPRSRNHDRQTDSMRDAIATHGRSADGIGLMLIIAAATAMMLIVVGGMIAYSLNVFARSPSPRAASGMSDADMSSMQVKTQGPVPFGGQHGLQPSLHARADLQET